MTFNTKYRIVKDRYLGYEAQYRYWWFPLWTQIEYTGICNTSSSVERAREICCWHKEGKIIEYFNPKDCK
jgi:hypothetical protein